MESDEPLEQTYRTLVDLWTSGVRDYHSLLSDYLTANSIFLAAIGFLVARQPPAFIFIILVLILCVFGIIITVQMAIVLGRFSAQNGLWEWRLRGMEQQSTWTRPKIFNELQCYRDYQESLTDERNDPQLLKPNWAIRQHRQWWAHREISLPLFFGIAYLLFLVWGLIQFFL